ncbi:MAG: hypothetical protein ACLR9K_00535 [Blautia sp.]
MVKVLSLDSTFAQTAGMDRCAAVSFAMVEDGHVSYQSLRKSQREKVEIYPWL